MVRKMKPLTVLSCIGLLCAWLAACTSVRPTSERLPGEAVRGTVTARPTEVALRWDGSQDALIVEVTDCCEGEPYPLQEEGYIPEARLWGDGRIVWVRHAESGERLVLEGRLAEDQMAALLERIAGAGFFGWQEHYMEDIVVDAASKCLFVALEAQSKRVCETHGGAPEDFYALFEWLSAGAGSSGVAYVPSIGYLSGEEGGYARLDLEWPVGLAGRPLEVAVNGVWIKGWELQKIWQAANSASVNVPMIGNENDCYFVALQVPGVSWKEPPEPLPEATTTPQPL